MSTKWKGQDSNLGLTIFLPAENQAWRPSLAPCPIPQERKGQHRAAQVGQEPQVTLYVMG